MKQRKPTPLITPVLWFITTGLWTTTFCINLSRGGRSGSLLLQGATVLVSLAVHDNYIRVWIFDFLVLELPRVCLI